MSKPLKITLWSVGALLAVLAIAAYLLRDMLQFLAMAVALAPGHDFAAAQAPPAPDYADEAAWAALPNRVDDADLVPQGLMDNQTAAAVDVFYIHPTTYISSASWNQPPDDTASRTMLNTWVLRDQASAFNGCCRVFAPRYRQATLYSFMDDSGNGRQALELAYADVAAAFAHFVEHLNNERPFIVAGHSQGARHAVPLIRDHIVATPLEQRLVAAYPVGYAIDAAEVGIPVCRSAEETGCFVSWNAVGPHAGGFGSERNVCVNPLSWRADDALASHRANAGAFASSHGLDMPAGVADARCAGGRLLVSEIRSDRFSERPLGRDNYHIFDYGLFYASVRENAMLRTEAFLSHGDLARTNSSD